MTHMYFSAEGRISYGHLGRTNSCSYYFIDGAAAAAGRMYSIMQYVELDVAAVANKTDDPRLDRLSNVFAPSLHLYVW